MTGTTDQVAEAATSSWRVSRPEDDGTPASGARPVFLEWVTRLVHTHRGRLYRLARREGLRDEDALDCVQDAFHTYLVLPQARQLVESDEGSIKLPSALGRSHERNHRRTAESDRPHRSA